MSGLWRRDCLYKVQVTGLAMHALEPDEEIDVLEHLPRCPACQAALRETEQLLAGFGVSVEQVEPPASLRGAILAEASETVQVPPTEPVTAAAKDVPDERDATESDTLPRIAHRRPPGGPLARPLPSSRSGLSRRGRFVAASLVVAGLVAIGGLTAYSAQLTQQRDATVAQAQTLAEIVTQLDRPGAQHATLVDSVGRVLAAVVVLDGKRTLVTSADLPANAADRDTYVVWGLGQARPQAIGTFDVLAAGTDVRTVGPEVPADAFSGYAISIEQGRSAPVSPSTVVAVGQLEA